jgi:hypothetical protein
MTEYKFQRRAKKENSRKRQMPKHGKGMMEKLVVNPTSKRDRVREARRRKRQNDGRTS